MVYRRRQQNLSMDKRIKNAIWYTMKYLLYVLMILFALSFLFVLVWVFISSLKTSMDYTEHVFALPKKIDWQNYVEVLTNLEFKGYSLWGMMGNTLKIMAINIFCSLTFPQMAAYALARFDFKGRKLIETVVYISMMIPVVGTLSVTLNFFMITKMYDTFWLVLFSHSTGLGFAQMVLTTFYRGMENAFAEAAYMDGASEWVVFWKIYYPQSLPVMLPSLLGGIIGTWNDFMTGYLYLPSHPTIALGLQQMQKTYVTFGNDYPLMFAGMVLMLIPILILFARFSKIMLNNKNLGALK